MMVELLRLPCGIHKHSHMVRECPYFRYLMASDPVTMRLTVSFYNSLEHDQQVARAATELR